MFTLLSAAQADDVRLLAVTYSNAKKKEGWRAEILWLLNKLYPTAKKTNTITFNISSSKVTH